MVNSEEFASRLQHIMDHYHLNGSSFAESIGVQRSAISHILSGRNKPSLEFVMKILEAYPDVELYWLLNGKGSGPFKKTSPSEDEDLFSSIQQQQQPEVKASPEPFNQRVLPVDTPAAKPSKRVKKVLIFYDDNTFEEIENLL